MAIVCCVALVRVAIYIVAARNYGYFRDELYYLACGEHPAWGYMDQPPLIAWIAWLLEHTIGVSLYALRLLPMLADVGSIVLTGLLARKLGSKRWAMFLASLAVLVAPIYLTLSHLFTMNAFDPLLWTLIAWFLVDLVQTGNERNWLWIGVLTGITLLNKYGVLFFVAGLLVGVAFSQLRRSFARPWFWAGAGLATLIALPNFLWQLHWNFPFVQLVSSVRKNGRDVMLPPLPYLAQQSEMMGFVSSLLVVLALWFLISPRGKRYAVLAGGFLSVLGCMLLLKGKFYYVAPVYPVVFAPGAVFFEQLTDARVIKWFRPVYALMMLLVGALIAPTAIPLLSIEQYIAYTRKLGIQQQKFENQPESQLPQIYADMMGWEERVKIVAAYVHSLPPEEQKVTAIGASNYGDAGAVDLFGPKYGLPKAISTANNYWIWGPRDYTGQSLILMDEDSPEKYVKSCKSLVLVARPDNPYARPDENQPIYHCVGLTPDLQTLWPALKPWK
ncbi:glycosyltransferase family 39 protein [Acidicapsa dinghuensis]|uniref:Glycosyltransferase family 39 protein n=1 Tax=Acidicapsa dinghuensis TaxID=2218256 RepID=A0ABW1ENL4_9BACT|nr:glycosyltransferase family 39 protein [Acidicapsa dinghuensis]